MNPIAIEIKNLFELIEEKEIEHQALINAGSDNKVLQSSQTGIELLKQRLQALEHILLDDSLLKE